MREQRGRKEAREKERRGVGERDRQSGDRSGEGRGVYWLYVDTYRIRISIIVSEV